MEEFAEQRETWLRGLLELPDRIPSHDTLSEVVGRLKPDAFATAFLRWVQAALPNLAGGQVCLDGKTRRGSRVGDKTVHRMSAYAAKARLVLMPQAVADKTQEIAAIPDLLSLLELKGAVVWIDAMGCQKTMAEQIIKAAANYLLALKDNHPPLREDVRLWLDTEAARGRLLPSETVEKDQGCIEIRRQVLSDAIEGLPQQPEWVGLPAVGRVESTRLVGDKTTMEGRYYLGSFMELARFAEAARGHGDIENEQHWILDVHSVRTPTDRARTIWQKIWP